MTDLEIVQTAARNVVRESRKHVENLAPDSTERMAATIATTVLQHFADELQRLRDQVYPR